METKDNVFKLPELGPVCSGCGKRHEVMFMHCALCGDCDWAVVADVKVRAIKVRAIICVGCNVSYAVNEGVVDVDNPTPPEAA